ncbi:MAG: CPBP family intramembrane glutamic endopeptidase [Planctomycetota bacterium]
MQPIEGSPFAVRRMKRSVVLTALVLSLLLAIAFNAFLFGSGAVVAVIDGTGGWVSGTLLANVVLLVVVVYGVLGRAGGASASDLGLQRQNVIPAVVVTIAIWLVLNAAQAIVSLAIGDAVSVSSYFVEQWRPRTAELLGQLFGNALFEEVLFRAVLLAQLALWLTPLDREPGRREVVLATVWSQVWFALQHVPNRLSFDAWQGVTAAVGDLSLLWFSGVCFSLLWLRTRNLLVAVGYHALGNCPFLVLVGPGWVHPVTMFVVLVVLIAFGPRWRWIWGGPRHS